MVQDARCEARGTGRGARGAGHGSRVAGCRVQGAGLHGAGYTELRLWATV
jgi:hypothetical protein